MLTHRQSVAFYYARKRRRARMLFPAGVIAVAGFTMQVTLTLS